MSPDRRFPSSGRKAALSFWGLVLAGGLLFIGHCTVCALLPKGIFEFSYSPSHSSSWLFHPMWGFTFEQFVVVVSGIVLAAPGLMLLTGAVARKISLSVPSLDILQKVALGLGIASVGFITWLVLGLYQGRAIVDDELTYAMQSGLLMHGKLGYNAQFYQFYEPFTILGESGATGKYLFGLPLIQLPGYMLNNQALMHIPLAAMTLLFVYTAISREGSAKIAALSVALLSVSPMFLFTEANGQSQAASLFCVSMLALGWSNARNGRELSGALLSGLAIGIGMIVRPQSMGPMGLVMGAAVGIALFRRRRFLPLASFAFVLGIFAVAILWYNNQITGSPFRLPWSLFTPVEKYGFGTVMEGTGVTHWPLDGFRNLLVSAIRFNSWWLGWPISLVLVGLWLMTGKRREHLLPWLLAGAALVVFNFGYYSPGISDTGPIYYYELLLPAAVFGANAILGGFNRFPRFTAVLLVVHLFLGTGSFVFYQHARLDRLVDYIHRDADIALEKLERPAVLFYESDCSEQIKAGWVLSNFPRRWRSPAQPVVTFPRPTRARIPEYLEAYPGRNCWYYRRNPESLWPELYRCENAEELLDRPLSLGKDCRYFPSSVEMLGLGNGD